MKRLGLIGSQTALSPVVYWQTIHHEAQLQLGENNTADLLLHCANTSRLRSSLQRKDWAAITDCLVEAGRGLMLAGADCLVICGSALNPAGKDVRRVLGIPLIDMAHAISFKVQEYRYRKIALLGIRTDREHEMWREKFAGSTILVPASSERRWLLERVEAIQQAGHDDHIAWKIEAQRIVSNLRKAGAQAIVLADHSLAHWIKPDESLLPLFDAEEVHAWIAALWALETGRCQPAPPCVLS